MENSLIDYNEYDKLTVVIHGAVSDSILPCYKALGWKLYSRTSSSISSNSALYVFYRKHKIQHKNRLQLLQVYMEDMINTLSKKAKIIHVKSLSLGFAIGLLSLVLIAGGVVVALLFKSILWGILLGVLGFAALISLAFIDKKIYEKENEKFEKIKQFAQVGLNKIHDDAKQLTGGMLDE